MLNRNGKTAVLNATLVAAPRVRLSQEEIDRIRLIAERGRNMDWNLAPIIIDGKPHCHVCDEEYPISRFTFSVLFSHMCCRCAQVVEDHEPRIVKKRGFGGHPARTFSGSDDNR